MTQTDETKRLLISTTEKEREQINAVLEKARQKNGAIRLRGVLK